MKGKSEISGLPFVETMILTGSVNKGSDQLLKITGYGNECMMYRAFFFLHIFFFSFLCATKSVMYLNINTFFSEVECVVFLSARW